MGNANQTSPHYCGEKRGLLRVDLDSLGVYLRRQHGNKISIEVEASTGIPARTVERWFSTTRPVAPRLQHMMGLLHAYGPSILAAAYPTTAPAWLDDAVRAERISRLEQQQAALDQEIAALREATG